MVRNSCFPLIHLLTILLILLLCFFSSCISCRWCRFQSLWCSSLSLSVPRGKDDSSVTATRCSLFLQFELTASDFVLFLSSFCFSASQFSKLSHDINDKWCLSWLFRKKLTTGCLVMKRRRGKNLYRMNLHRSTENYNLDQINWRRRNFIVIVERRRILVSLCIIGAG